MTNVRGYAAAALGAAVALQVLTALLSGGRFLGMPVAPSILVAVGLLALVTGGLAIHRRSVPLLGVSAGLLVLPALAPPPGALTPGRVALALAWALAVLAFVELTHMGCRYGTLRAAVERAGAPGGNLDRAMSEYVRTFTRTVLVTALVSGLVLAVHLALTRVGPRQFQASLEWTGPQGIVALTVLLLSLSMIAALARGADYGWLRRGKKTPATHSTRPTPEEVDLDAVE